MSEENKDEAKGHLQLTTDSVVKSTDAYSNLVRGLVPEELSQSGTVKLILHDLSKSESKVKELEPYRDKFYTVFTEKSVLQEKLAKVKRAEILYSFCITIGGIIIGLGKMFTDYSGWMTAIMVAIGIALIIGGVLFKTSNEK